MHFCLFNYWSYKPEKKILWDVHFRDIFDKNVIFDVLALYFIPDKYFFFENIFWYPASKISIFVNL